MPAELRGDPATGTIAGRGYSAGFAAAGAGAGFAGSLATGFFAASLAAVFGAGETCGFGAAVVGSAAFFAFCQSAICFGEAVLCSSQRKWKRGPFDGLPQPGTMHGRTRRTLVAEGFLAGGRTAGFFAAGRATAFGAGFSATGGWPVFLAFFHSAIFIDDAKRCWSQRK